MTVTTYVILGRFVTFVCAKATLLEPAMSEMGTLAKRPIGILARIQKKEAEKNGQDRSYGNFLQTIPQLVS